MNAQQPIEATQTQMRAALEAQRDAYLSEGVVTAETRIDRLARGIDVLIKYQAKTAEALNSDFSGRPREVSLLTDVGARIAPMKHAKKHLRKQVSFS